MSKSSVKTKARKPSGKGAAATKPGRGTTSRAGSGSGSTSRASSRGRESGGTIFGAASQGAATMSRQMVGLLDQQVGHGADMIGHVADAARAAADDLEMNSPQVAGMVRNIADRIDDYADEIQDQSVEELLGTASDFARRRPAVVVGLAALLGFVAFRSLKSAQSSRSGVA